MSKEEYDELMQNLRYLQFLLNFHVENKSSVGMDDADFEKYIDDILDKILAIKKKLRAYENG